MIPVYELYNYCKKMLSEKWGYIWGTAGIKWTDARQKATSNDMAKKYGSKWIGHMVADCSGVMVYIWKQFGLSIYHGSNTIARKYVGTITKTPSPGYAAFKWNKADTAKFLDGKGDFYHIGIVGEDGTTVYEAKGTQSGFVTSKASTWHYFAPFKDIDYKITSKDKEVIPMLDNKIYLGYVSTASGSLNLRNEPNTSSKIIATIPKNAEIEVLEEPVTGWYKVNYQNYTGYVSKKYVTITGEKTEDKKEETPAIKPPEEPPVAPSPTQYYGVFILCRDELEAKNISKLYTNSTVVNYTSFNGEEG